MKNCPLCGSMLGDATTVCPNCAGKTSRSLPPMLTDIQEDATFAALFWGAFASVLIYIAYVFIYASGSLRSVPQLVEAVKHPRHAGSRRADLTCSQLAGKGQQTILIAIEFLKSQDYATERCGSVILSALGPKLADLPGSENLVISMLKSGKDSLRYQALGLVGNLGSKMHEAIPSLVDLLMNRDPRTANMAALTLKQLGPPAQAAVPELAQLLGNKDPQGRLRAAEALLAIDDSSADRVLRVALEVAGSAAYGIDTRQGALRILRVIGQRHGDFARTEPEVLRTLITCLKDRDRALHGFARIALGGFGAQAQAAVPALVEMLDSTDCDLRRNAASVLGDVGPAAKEAVAHLKTLLKDESRCDDGAYPKLGAQYALKRIDPSATTTTRP